MLHVVTVYFVGEDPTKFKVLAETATGALLKVIAFDWTVEQRKAFLGARVDSYVKGQVI